MDYWQEIRVAHTDPERLEDLYQTARRESKAEEFATDLLTCYQESPDNILYAAWYYRLQPTLPEERAVRKGANWRLAIPLSVLAGLVLWLLSDPRLTLPDGAPFFILVWAPIEACFVIAFLMLTAKRPLRQSLSALLGLVGLSVYATVFAWLPGREQYRILMMLHLPLWAWIGVGLNILGLRSDHPNRFTFLAKSIEVFITAGVFAAAGGVFSGITSGLFQALGIILPDAAMRLVVVGIGGAVPILAVASVYDPYLSPVVQRFEQGLGKLIPTLMRLLLPPTLLVLVVYILFIPLNFMAPFRSRELLIVYNAMLFAIMVLLIGVTPVHEEHLSSKYQRVLRTGILALVILAVLVSLYALSAIVYRTVLAALTPNRLTVIGWNSINIGILALLSYKQFKYGVKQWVSSMQSAFGTGAMAYIAWAIFLILLIPLLFP